MTQPNVPYREGGAHGGLPFPRANMTAYVVVTALVAACGLLFPLLLLGRSPSYIWMSVREGGASMYVLLLLMPVVSVIVSVLSGLGIRGRRIPPAAIVGAALVPSLVAFLGTLSSQSRTAAVLSGESVDPGVRMRIAFEGTQEALASLQLGGAICAFALGAAAVGCAGIAASVDRARVGAPASPVWLVSLAAPIVGFVASVVVMIMTRSLGASPLAFGLSLLSLLIVAVIAPLSTRAAPALRDWHDAAEQKRMLGAVIAAAVAASLALWLLDRTAIVAIDRFVLGVCSGESVDPSQRARILMEGRHETRAFVMLSVIHVATVLLAFAPAVALGMSRGRSPLGAAGVISLALGVIGALGFFGVQAHGMGVLTKTAKGLPPLTFPVALPTIADAGPFRHPHQQVTVVDRTGAIVGGAPREDDQEWNPWHSFAADKDARAAAVFALVPRGAGTMSKGQARSVDLVVAAGSGATDRLEGVDPDIRALMAPEATAVEVEVLLAPSEGRRPSVTFIDDTTVLVNDVETLRFGSAFQRELRQAIGADEPDVHVNIRDTTTVGALVTVIGAITSYRAPIVHVMLATSAVPEGTKSRRGH